MKNVSIFCMKCGSGINVPNIKDTFQCRKCGYEFLFTPFDDETGRSGGNCYADELAEVIQSCLESDLIEYYYNEEYRVFRFYNLLAGRLSCARFQIEIGNNTYTVTTEWPLAVKEADEAEADALKRFIYLANYKMCRDGEPEGCEMDMPENERKIVCRCIVDCSWETPTKEFVFVSIMRTVRTFELFEPGLLGIMFGKMTPEDAIALCGEASHTA